MKGAVINNVDSSQSLTTVVTATRKNRYRYRRRHNGSSRSSPILANGFVFGLLVVLAIETTTLQMASIPVLVNGFVPLNRYRSSYHRLPANGPTSYCINRRQFDENRNRDWWIPSLTLSPRLRNGRNDSHSNQSRRRITTITEVVARSIVSRNWSRFRGALSNRFPRKRRKSPISNSHGGVVGKRGWVHASTVLAFLCCGMLLGHPQVAVAGGGGGFGGTATSLANNPLSRKDLLSLGSLWFFLFVALALLHAAEIAITTLYPWKVREIAEEEEKMGKSRGVFTTLNEDITRVLTTILVTSTACSIYMTTLFTQLFPSIFGSMGHVERYGAFVLTALTLFFVELLPKSLGVVNAERVARLMIPPITIVSRVVSPLGISLSWLAKFTLRLLGVREEKKGGGSAVSDSQLRLIVTGALDSGTIDHGEREMIQGVLNLQNQRIKEVMRPRVDITAVPIDMSVVKVLGIIRESGYSRIPAYDGEIDNIVGIVLAKSVLDFFVHGVIVNKEEDDNTNSNYNETAAAKKLEAGDATIASKNNNNGKSRYSSDAVPIYTKDGHEGGYVRTLTAAELATRMEMSISDANLIESCYFVPDTANGWAVLQEMRKRRVHMAVVVDEFGGTEGLVSMEDIVEEVVGGTYSFVLVFRFFDPRQPHLMAAYLFVCCALSCRNLR